MRISVVQAEKKTNVPKDALSHPGSGTLFCPSSSTPPALLQTPAVPADLTSRVVLQVVKKLRCPFGPTGQGAKPEQTVTKRRSDLLWKKCDGPSNSSSGNLAGGSHCRTRVWTQHRQLIHRPFTGYEPMQTARHQFTHHWSQLT